VNKINKHKIKTKSCKIYSSKEAAQKMGKGNNTYLENTILREVLSPVQPE